MSLAKPCRGAVYRNAAEGIGGWDHWDGNWNAVVAAAGGVWACGRELQCSITGVVHTWGVWRGSIGPLDCLGEVCHNQSRKPCHGVPGVL
jgi:hypothetical protein